MVKMNRMDEARMKQYLLKYQNPEVTRREIVNVMKEYKSLIGTSESFVFNDGSCQELFNLQGTIPVMFKGSVYNIPICIWLMDTHPNNAPMCYVKPTADMTIKVSMYVDHNGKIYLPYLHDWVPHSSDLLGLIQVMIVTFGEHPPVFAKMNTQTTHYPTQPSFMPLPSGDLNAASMTPYPHFVPNPPYGSGMPPPYPPAGGAAFGGYPSFGSYSNPGYPASPYSSTPYPPVKQPSPSMPAMNSGNSDTITEEHIRASLISAVEDKLRRRLIEQHSQLQAELETLRRTQQELTNGSSKLTDLFNRLQKEKLELDKNINILHDKETELEREITKLSENQSVDVDEAVTTIAPLYKQMLNAFAEEAATEDAIYYLGEGLRQGVIDLDAFLKQVRQLSRRQFMLRALMLRCRQKAGLAG
ncbi:tumor susceptibility gene 101 protein [Diachasmimorpha longicaudata]|uniref:tumor susceptibility gene 101 protein n=1 Tax=Diachasmimorpha longicaudata TaxID=58733 RepID=UPI0030B8ABAE